MRERVHVNRTMKDLVADLRNEKKTTLDINFRTDNNQLQTKENRNERENN